MRANQCSLPTTIQPPLHILLVYFRVSARSVLKPALADFDMSRFATTSPADLNLVSIDVEKVRHAMQREVFHPHGPL